MQVNILYRCQNTLDQDDPRLDLSSDSTSPVIELDSDTFGKQHTYHYPLVMFLHYTDTSSIYYGDLITAQQQHQDDISSTDGSSSTDKPNDKPRKSSGTHKLILRVHALFHCSHYIIELHKTISVATDIAGRKKAIQVYLDKIKNGIEKTNDQHILDRILSLLIQADTSYRVLESESETDIKEFEKKDTFAPAQKNEIQLRFKKTCGNPGRKKKHMPLR